ncbi:MAG: DUF1883 domain-containing protein [Tepidisphaeraceae bacterium]
MNFQHYDLGYRQAGEIVQVTLSGNAANVRLMDSSNLSSYKSGRRHTFYGGMATKSPVNLQIPRSGNWHVAVDMQGLRGTVRTSIRLLPTALPPLREIPLASMPSLVRDEPPEGSDDVERRFDVFISHASEDKDEVVRPLAEALRSHGLEVWYDEFELKIGMSLRRTIDKGIAGSRFGIVVMSKAFFGKGWTNYELDGIVTRSVTSEQTVLPIWHNVSKQEVIGYSPSLADKVARSTATHTAAEIAAEIADVIQSTKEAA